MNREDVDIIIGVVSIFLGVVSAIPIFKGYYFGLLTSSNARNMKKLQRERDLFVMWRNSNSDVVIYLITGIIILFAILGVSLLFHGLPSNSKGVSFDPLVDFLSGFAIYMVSVGRLGKISRLRNFDKTVKFLDSRIKRLEVKMQKQKNITGDK